MKELRCGKDAEETLLNSKVFIEFSLCGKLCETNPSIDYPKDYETPVRINHDEIMPITVRNYIRTMFIIIFSRREARKKTN